MRALLSLTALATITENSSFPLDAAPDLWSRAWPWMRFLHTHWGCLPGIPLSDEAGVYERMSLLVTNLNRHSGAAVAIVRARGVRTILAKTWARFLNDDSLGTDEITSHDLTRPRQFRRCYGRRSGESNDFRSSLLSGGIVVSLVSALRYLSVSPLKKAPGLAQISLYLLECYLKLPDAACKWLALALEEGLLQFIISFGAESEAATRKILQNFVAIHLPRGLSFCSVVNQMKTSLSEATELPGMMEFRGSVLFKDWEAFTSLAQWYIKVLQEWEADGRPSFQGCDNMQCALVERRTEFRSCAGCVNAFYCSRECQVADWQDGHREDCHPLQNQQHYFRSSQYQFGIYLTSRERAFERAVLRADYRRRRPEIALRTIAFMHQHPGEPFCIMFDYLHPKEITCRVISKQSLETVAEMGTDCDGHWRRLSRSGGCMEINVLVTLSGVRVVLKRSTSSRFYDGLRSIADQVPPGMDVLTRVNPEDRTICELIQSVDDDIDYWEIH
ncbi:hypothetical protein B0H13DRAFT_1896091 [Mycena leptocephala]|nr:hypothetical protein B0H13DRAFT_1896091 [Mycena leptocephala]